MNACRSRSTLCRQPIGRRTVLDWLIGISVLVIGLFATSAAADLRLLVPDPADTATFAGHGGFSADGLGQNGGGGFVQAEVPLGSTVMQAYLYGSYYSVGCNISPSRRTIDFDGTFVVLTVLPNVPPLGGSLCAARAEVTAQVAAKVGVGGGVFDFRIGNDPPNLDGVALVVIYENPTLPMTTVAVLDGGAAQSGDMATFNFVGPLDTEIPDFSAVLSLGIGFGFQGFGGIHQCGTGQFSTVDVNGVRMTTCAGHHDDGVPNNGGLITVGGVGDVVDNPPNPNGSGGLDDELYDLAPFLSDGDTQLVIETANPSRDDIVFLAVIGITAEARVTTEICDDGIDNDGDGLIDREDPDCLICGDGILDPGEECDDGNTSDGDGCSAECQNEDNQAPVALCQDAMVETTFGTCEASPSLDAGSYDPDGSPLALVQSPEGPYPPGNVGVTLTVEDPSGATDSCAASLTVIDPERPAPLCNAPVALDGALGSATFTASAADNCPAQVTVGDASCRNDDLDDDGVPDDDDECPGSDQRQTVIIEDCDTGVLNVLFETGCTISDRILVCGETASNHGQFVSCVAHLTNELVSEGVITGAEKGEIMSCAAQSSIPEGFPPNPFGAGLLKNGEDTACPVTVNGTTLSFPDLPGIGLLSWTVTATDPSGNSVTETCTVLVQNPATTFFNLPPAADAGPDQVAAIGQTVQLDGSASLDLDGGIVSYQWTLEAVPNGSTAALSDPTSSTPSLVVDLPGIYTAALVVDDGSELSVPDRMEIQVLNQRPIAGAGPDRGAALGDTVTLDGSGSFDPDGDPLIYAWTLAQQPAGSTATLSDPSAVAPMLTVDVRGVYVAQLVVSDGQLSSLIDAAIVFAPNTPPVADAGPDQDVSVFDLVQLDGSASSDFEGDSLTFQWTLLSAPEDSLAQLSSPTAVDPTFEPDVFGVYEFELVVSDGFDASVPDTVTVTTVNTPPVADAGEDQVRFLLDLVQLDGTGSSDAENDPLTYEWTLINQPADSMAELSDPTSPTPTFVADVRGVYVAELTVFDGQRFSRQPDAVTISVVNRAPVAVTRANLNAAVTYPAVLDGSASFDPDDDPLGFQWLFVSRPAGSVAALSRADTPRPFFTPDVAGDYVVELQVSDGQLVGTAAVTVSAVAANAPPNAEAGDGVTVLVGQTASLDGGASGDPEGAALSFSWSFQTLPSGSALNDGDLMGGATATPSFAPDVAGIFVVELTVDDGTASDADTVEVLAVTANAPPHADPGPDLSTQSSQPFVVDGGASFDPDAGPSPLVFSWTVVSVPPGSAIGDADLATPQSPTTTFIPDLEGLYVLRLTVSDAAALDAGNVVIHVDDAAPGLTFLEPTDGEVFYRGTLQSFTISYFDQGTGLDLASFRLLVAGEDVTAAATTTSTFASFSRSSPLDPGSYQAEAQIADLAGNVVTVLVTFTVSSDVFEATADCSPTSGAVPLAVRFRSLGVFTGGSIIRYRWDFEGDGRFDTSDAVAQDYTRTFTTGGTREAVLEITNNFGDRVSDTCTVQVSGTPPEVTVDAVPSNGAAPLVVAFTCDATDADGVVALYEWDFEGDGIYDFSSPTSGSVSHTYSAQGTFPAVCRVTDGDGLVTVASAINSTVRVGPAGTPTVTAVATPAGGVAPLDVTFDGSAVDDGTIVLWEWDFDGDGSFDFSSTTSPLTTFNYGAAGVFEALLRVTDDSGLTSIDGVEIAVDVAVTLTIADDTFDPSAGETVGVDTTLSGGVPVRVLVKNRGGDLLRILFDGFRPAGAYTDTWDGTDDGGFPLAHGPYFVVVEYDVGGETRMLDLTNTTGGVRYNPPRSSFPSSFSPLEDDLLDVNFTVPAAQGASEVTAFIGLFNVDVRFVTLLERVPFGVGSHTIFWDGTAPSGGIAVAPPGDRFLYGAFGFTLPDNAIMLVAAPTLSGVSVDPNYFDPATPDFLTPDDPVAVVTYTLDKMADVELTATNLTTGVVVRTIVDSGVASGAGLTLSWDGRTDNGLFADKGDYRLTLRAVDADGNASINRFALVRVFY